jgi:ABC-type nitrate/sulfonate/bicarbonate transport system substrate-binding protein
MLTSELSELAAVVERIRAEAHPDLDKEFVEAVLAAEAEAAGQQGAALFAIRAAVDKTLGSPAD